MSDREMSEGEESVYREEFFVGEEDESDSEIIPQLKAAHTLPERVWMRADNLVSPMREHFEKLNSDDVEFVRAALYSALKKEVEQLKAHIADLNADFTASLAHCDQYHIEGQE